MPAPSTTSAIAATVANDRSRPPLSGAPLAMRFLQACPRCAGVRVLVEVCRSIAVVTLSGAPSLRRHDDGASGSATGNDTSLAGEPGQSVYGRLTSAVEDSATCGPAEPSPVGTARRASTESATDMGVDCVASGASSA